MSQTRRMQRRDFLARLGMLLPAMSLAACRPAVPSKSPEPLTLLLAPWPDTALLQVALDQGYFAEAGLNVTARFVSHGVAGFKDLMAGKADVAFVAEAPIMLSVLHGGQPRVITGIGTSTRSHLIAARRDHGITRMADLRGKRIAYPPGSTVQFFTESLLEAHGLPPGQYIGVPMSPDQVMGALTAGEVDAAGVWGFMLVALKRQLGDRVIGFEDRELYAKNNLLVTRADYAQAHPERLRRLLHALLKAERFTAEQPAAAQAIVSRLSSIPLEQVHTVWPDFYFDLELSRAVLFAFKEQTRWALRRGLAPAQNMPDFHRYIDTAPMASTAPSRVEVGQ